MEGGERGRRRGGRGWEGGRGKEWRRGGRERGEGGKAATVVRP